MDLSTININCMYYDIIHVLTLLSSDTYKNIKFDFLKCELNENNFIVDCNLHLNGFPFDNKKFNSEHIVDYMIGVNKLSIKNISSDLINSFCRLFESKLKIFDFVGYISVKYNKNIKLYNIYSDIINHINQYITNYINNMKNIIIHKCNSYVNKKNLKKNCIDLNYDKLFHIILDNDVNVVPTFFVNNISDFKNKLKKFTYELSDCVQFNNNLCFSGGLLNDIIRNNFSESLQDMDIFLVGDKESKVTNINNIINSVKNKFGNDNVFVGFFSSVIYIFVAGIPRILQLICTNKSICQSAIFTFDQTHLLAYYENDILLISEDAYHNIQTLTTDTMKKNIKLSRLFKTCKKGYDISNIINYENIKITFDELNKINSINNQNAYYLKTNNLTNYQFNKNELFSIFKIKPFDINNINFNGSFEDYHNKEIKSNIYLNNSIKTITSGIMVYGKIIKKLHFYPANKYNIYISLNEYYSNAIINTIKSLKTDLIDNFKSDTRFNKIIKDRTFDVPIYNSDTYKLNSEQLNDCLPNIDCSKIYPDSGIIIKCKVSNISDFLKMIEHQNYLFVIKTKLYFSFVIGLSFTIQDLIKTNLNINSIEI